MIKTSSVVLLTAVVACAQEKVRPTVGTVTPITAGYDHGFFLRDEDREHEFKVEGLMQVNGRFFEPNLPDRDSEFFLRRFRLEFTGKLNRVYRFKMEPNFTEDDVELNEAWVGMQAEGSDFRIILGRMKEPFSLEELSSLRRLDFVEKSLLNQFVPAEDHGITLFGKAFDKTVDWGLAYYNGTGGDDLNSDKDVAARLVFHFSDNLQIGGAVTHGRANQSIAGKDLRLETRVPFATFEPGSRMDGDLTRLGAEGAYFHGPFSVKSEYIHIDHDMFGTAAGTVTYRGYYVAGTWLLTGEPKSWYSVDPQSPFLPGLDDNRLGSSGTGAIELVARFSELDLDRDLVALGLITPSTFPGRVRSYDIGMNWYLTTHARVLAHYVHTDYGNSITRAGDTRSGEDALMVQFQLNF